MHFHSDFSVCEFTAGYLVTVSDLCLLWPRHTYHEIKCIRSFSGYTIQTMCILTS